VIKAVIGISFILLLSAFGAELKLVSTDVLYADTNIVIWQADGTTRVAADGFVPAETVWKGRDVVSRPSGEIIDGFSVLQPEVRSIEIWAARREYESFQIVLTPKTKDTTILDVQISDFVKMDNPGIKICKERIQQNLIGYIWGEIPPRGDQWMKEAKPGDVLGPYPDILMPAKEWKTAAAGKNYTLWFTVQVPADAAAGMYKGSVVIQTAEAGLLMVPVELTVWNFELPAECSIDSNLMSLDISSLCYFYRTAPWEERVRELVDQWAELMVQHRFSPALIPEFPRPDVRNFPSRADGRFGKGLLFNGNEMTLAGPDDWQMRERFTLSFWLKTSQGSNGRILEEQWLSALQSPSGLRPVGHSILLTDGMLVASIGHDTWNPTDEMETRPFEQLGVRWKTGPEFSTVRAVWPDDEQWHYVTFLYAPGRLELFIDAKPVAAVPLNDTMVPSYGIAALGGPESRFAIDEIRWSAAALSPEQIASEMKSAEPVDAMLSAYGFEEKLYDFDVQKKRYAEEGSDEEYAFKRAAWWMGRGLYINTLEASFITTLDALPQVRQRCEKLRDLGLLGKCVFVVPHDETPFGPKAEENRAFAKAVHEQIPGLKTYMTLGGMKGGASSKKEKADAIAAYRGYVDVWSMIPSVFDQFYETHFKSYIAEGAKFSPYIHRTDITQDDMTTAASRRFFWYLWKYDIDMFTLWCTTLWSQPSKMGETRAAKRTWPVERGLQTIKRNNGIMDGAMFYPGRNGLLGSIRASCWRDGIEDYEYLKILEQRTEKARAVSPASVAVADAEKLLAEMKAIQVYGSNWEAPPTKDSGFFYENRRRVADAILRLNVLQLN
jgi:hypothetical protein